MVKHLTTLLGKIIPVCLFGGLYGVGVCAHAQIFVDPTRPPGSLEKEGPAGIAAPASGPVLQSVLISPRRVVAIISGDTVGLGDKVGDARVVKIDEGKVVLRNGKETQTLKLYPDIEKQPASSPADGKPIQSGNKGK